MKISLFDKVIDNVPKMQEIGWSAFVERFSHENVRGTPCTLESHKLGRCIHKDGPLWSPAAYDLVKKRKNENVTAICAIVFDLDHTTRAKTVEFRSKWFGQYRYLMHSSHGYNRQTDDFCVRIVIPLVQELTYLKDFADTYMRLAKFFGVEDCDQGGKELCRFYYLPSSPQDGEYFVEESKGEILDIDTVLKPKEQSEPEPLETYDAKEDVFGKQVEEPKTEHVEYAVKEIWKHFLLGTSNEEIKDLIYRARDGKPLAEKGSRDAKINLLMGYLSSRSLNVPKTNEAYRLEDTMDLPLAVVMQMVRVSLNAMEPPETGTWLNVAANKFARYRVTDVQARDTKIGEKKRVQDLITKVAAQDMAEEAPTFVDEDGKYPEVLIEKWMAKAGMTKEQLARRWIIRYEGGNFCFYHGKYSGFARDLDFRFKAYDLLAPSPVELFYMTKKGELRRKAIDDIMHEHATVANAVKGSFSLQDSYYDPKDRIFYEAITPRRDLAPKFDEEVNTWLTLLAGTQEKQFFDWLALFPNLNRMLSVLYLEGDNSIGKSLFASSISRIWSETGAVRATDVLGTSFNDMTGCPVIWADEGLPPVKNIGTEIRALIGTKAHTVNKKYKVPYPVDGAVRMVITANNPDVLVGTNESLTKSDVDAIQKRFFYMKASTTAGKYLKELNLKYGNTPDGSPYIDLFRSEDRVAKHLLWLESTRKVETQARFGVESTDDTFTEKLLLGFGINSTICEMLVRYLSTENQRPRENLLFVKDGELFVNTDFFCNKERWETYAVGRRLPTAQTAANSISQLSRGTVESEDGTVFFKLNTGLLTRWSARTGVGSVKKIRAFLDGKKNE